MAKHSQEPWFTEPSAARSRVIIIRRSPDGTRIAEAMNYNVEANARLIAAAPDMLAALKFARPFMAVANLDSSHDLISEIDAAIAKAEGRE